MDHVKMVQQLSWITTGHSYRGPHDSGPFTVAINFEDNSLSRHTVTSEKKYETNSRFPKDSHRRLSPLRRSRVGPAREREGQRFGEAFRKGQEAPSVI